MDALKTKQLADGSIALAFAAPSNPDGTLYNAETAPKPLSSAREYVSAPVRYYDTYWKPQRGSIWYTVLTLNPVNIRYELLDGTWVNALKCTGIEFPAFPTAAFGAATAFDVATTGLILWTSDPSNDLAQKVVFDLYYLPLCTFRESPAPEIKRIEVPGYVGGLQSAVFSPNGLAIAFLKAEGFRHHSSKNDLFVIGSIETSQEAQRFELMADGGNDKWDLDPDSLFWSNDGKEIYIFADDRGRHRIFRVATSTTSFPNPLKATPKAITDTGHVSTAYTLSNASHDRRILITKSTMISTGMFGILNPEDGERSLLPCASISDSDFGLHASQIDEIIFEGGGDYSVQAWVIRPSDFNPANQYPVAFVIHGGPSGAWADQWSEIMVIAEQGYVVVAPNITGSTGFGLKFNEAVFGQWGGRPYRDIVKCFEFVRDNISYADTANSILVGASYGGYMALWVAGQPLAKELKTLVCHDGIFSTVSMMATDVFAGLDRDMGGFLWENQKGWLKYDPASYTHDWSKPMLIIHSDTDYRCPITQGLAAFNVCQAKGIESRFLNFPDESHIVTRNENSLIRHRTMLGWMNKYCGVDGGVVLQPPISQPWR